MTAMDPATLNDIEQMLDEAMALQKQGKMYVYEPAPKHAEFMGAGSKFRIRYLQAGNRCGKTMCAATEMSYHLTGIYPAWWTGRKFDTPIRAWAAGDGAQLVRDTIQKYLCGEPTGDELDLGTGMIPKECFTRKPTTSHGVSNAFDTVFIRHKSGGTSTLTFKSYDQGRSKFQGESVHVVWLDEEPDKEEIFDECLTRTMSTKGLVLVTFTPLKSETDLVKRLISQGNNEMYRVHMTLTVEDCPFYSKDQIDSMVSVWPKHQQRARQMGLPVLGDDAVFEDVVREKIAVPIRVDGMGRILHRDHGEIDTRHWAKLWAIDFGIGHPFAAVLLGWDRDYDAISVLTGFKVKDQDPKQHAAHMKRIAANVPVAWPHDGNQREKGSAQTLASFYKKEGLLMMPTHATFKDGGYSTEAGITEMLQRMRSERFYVSDYFEEWWMEFFGYYREKGLIIKKNDDLMSATRIGVMQIRSAKPVGLGSKIEKREATSTRYSEPGFGS